MLSRIPPDPFCGVPLGNPVGSGSGHPFPVDAFDVWMNVHEMLGRIDITADLPWNVLVGIDPGHPENNRYQVEQVRTSVVKEFRVRRKGFSTLGRRCAAGRFELVEPRTDVKFEMVMDGTWRDKDGFRYPQARIEVMIDGPVSQKPGEGFKTYRVVTTKGNRIKDQTCYMVDPNPASQEVFFSPEKELVTARLYAELTPVQRYDRIAFSPSGARPGETVTISTVEPITRAVVTPEYFEFLGLTRVAFGGVPSRFTVSQDRWTVTATVPLGARTGAIEFNTADGDYFFTREDFTVLP